MMYNPKRVAKAIYWLIFGNQAQKRRVRKECARFAASLFGDFPIGDDNKIWRTDRKFLDDFNRLSPLTPYSQERKYTLREFARFTQRLPGAIAECGCYQGASAFFMAQESGVTPIHLFDSFEGLSTPSEKDAPLNKDSLAWEAGNLRTTEDIARETLKDFPNVVFHKGWIPEIFRGVPELSYRLVHIDVDLYEPTMASLRYFYRRMCRGGVIVMDDYGFLNCPGAYAAANEFADENEEHIVHLPTGQGVILIR